MALLTGGGAMAGGITGAASAPYDYWPEAVMRGAVTGGAAGLGAVAGSLAGGALGSQANKLNLGILQGSPRSLGIVGGAAAGGIAGGVLGSPSSISPWEKGDLPVMEQFDRRMRRRVPEPEFSTTIRKTGAAESVLSGRR